MPKNPFPIRGSRIGGAGKPGSRSVKAVNGTNKEIPKGTNCNYASGADAGKVQVCPTNGTGPFVFCIEDKPATGDMSDKASIVEDGLVLGLIDGDIGVGKYTMRSGSVAGAFEEYDGSNSELINGRYLRHEGEDSGDQTDAEDGDIGVIDFNVGATGATT